MKAIGKMKRGTVKWFDDIKGYGYIEDDAGELIFVHFTDILEQNGFRSLDCGDVVKFEAVPGEFGARAILVVKL